MTWEEHVKLVQAGEVGFPVVEVIWEDASAFALEWAEEIEKKVRMVTSVGYLVHEDEDAISLVALINTAQVGHGIVIPMFGIHSWRELS